ncbi:MAG: hypothetical protein KDB00_27420 [Planctomycetales bacterium]|nr:hypothetical protein [Planctomycetales bacterium]
MRDRCQMICRGTMQQIRFYQSDHMSGEMNPYSPPSESSETVASVEQTRSGPALYIVFAGLIGGIASIPFMAYRNPFGFAMILIGCISGGLVYRSISRAWPHDESVRPRQIIYSAIAVTLPPIILALLAQGEGHSIPFAFIGAVVGVSVACGILVSGTRRAKATTSV